jgi:hypothetical protein
MGVFMGVFGRQGWGRALLLTAVLAVSTSNIFAQQVYSAQVPFLVNVNAHVSARDGNQSEQIYAQANQESTLMLYVLDIPASSVSNQVQRQMNTPTIISNRSGKISVNVPTQSYRNVEASLYTVNGKRVLNSNISTANNTLQTNLATGVYLLSVRATNSNIITSRVTHNGGVLNISVVFGNEVLSTDKHLAKEIALGDWKITVSATSGGYADSVYTLPIFPGANPLQNIILHAATPTVPLNVKATVTAVDKITLTWPKFSEAKGYFVYRRIGTSGQYENIGGVSSALFSDPSYYRQRTNNRYCLLL